MCEKVQQASPDGGDFHWCPQEVRAVLTDFLSPPNRLDFPAEMSVVLVIITLYLLPWEHCDSR